MKIPKKLKIGGHQYEVEYPYAFKERGDITGQHDAESLKIRISSTDSYSHKEKPESVIAENFLHEILHAADYISGHEIFKGNEAAVCGVSEILFQILRDNKLHFDEED